MSEDAPAGASAPMGIVSKMVVITGLLGLVAGPLLLVGVVAPTSRTLEEREGARRLRVGDLAATAPGEFACLEARVSSEQPTLLGDVVAHEEWEHHPKGRRLRDHARPALLLEDGQERALVEAERYVLEKVEPVELGFEARSGTESLAVRRGDVVTVFGTTRAKPAAGPPAFGARVVVMGPAEASLEALRTSVSRLRLVAAACMAAGVPAVVVLVARRRRRAEGQAA